MAIFVMFLFITLSHCYPTHPGQTGMSVRASAAFKQTTRCL